MIPRCIKRLLGKPVRVEHVRYVKKPTVDPVSKAIAMARSMGRDDLVARLER